MEKLMGKSLLINDFIIFKCLFNLGIVKQFESLGTF